MSEPPTPRLTRAQINATKIITLPPPSPPLSTFTSLSEEISKYIINKLISLSITSHFISKVEDKLGDHCFTYTKQSLNTYITSQHICYDKDETKMKPDDQSQHHNPIPTDLALITKHIPPIQKYESQHTIIPAMKFDLTNTFFNNYYHGENNWSIMTEPSTNEVDRYASSMIMYNKANNVNNDHHHHNHHNDVNNSIDNEMKGQVDGKSALKAYNAVVKKKEEQVKKKKKKGLMEIMSEMSCHDIAWEENEEQIKYDNEFEELRKEKEMELVRLELEKKVKVKEEQEVQIKIKQEVSKRNEYKNKKITIDANGKVVIIKPFKLDILAKDFIAIRSNTKVIKKKSQQQQQPSINDDNNNTNIIRNRKKLPSIETNNPPLSPHNVNVSSTLERKIERGPVIPSGSCFDKINPEIGVTIIEDKKHKTGGKDFFKKFNKYSLENYNRQLRDTISSNLTYINNNFAFTQSNLMMHSDFNNMNNNALLTDVNNYNTISTFNKKNPLFKTNNFFGSSFTTNMMQRSMNQSVYEPQIKMNASNQSNLKGTLDYLNLISEKEEKLLNNKGLNRTNIFKEKKLLTESGNDVYTDNNTNNNKSKLNDMTKFATGLISGDNWGSSLSKGNAKANYGRKAYKPHMKEIEKELGMTTLNNSKRLPRMRGMMYKTMQK